MRLTAGGRSLMAPAFRRSGVWDSDGAVAMQDCAQMDAQLDSLCSEHVPPFSPPRAGMVISCISPSGVATPAYKNGEALSQSPRFIRQGNSPSVPTKPTLQLNDAPLRPRRHLDGALPLCKLQRLVCPASNNADFRMPESMSPVASGFNSSFPAAKQPAGVPIEGSLEPGEALLVNKCTYRNMKRKSEQLADAIVQELSDVSIAQATPARTSPPAQPTPGAPKEVGLGRQIKSSAIYQYRVNPPCARQSRLGDGSMSRRLTNIQGGPAGNCMDLNGRVSV